MLKHKSAIKRHRQSVVRNLRNTSIEARLRTLVKKARLALDGADAAAAKTSVDDASRALAKAVSKGVLHRNNASRRISRLQTHLAAKSAPSAPAS